jgi:hypothetical protein
MINPDAQPGGDPPTGYAQLARWLLRSLVSENADARDVETKGREIGRELALADAKVGGERRMHDVLTALGFQPQRESVGDDRLTYRLRNCPYREAVRERQPLVCGLHRGITQGLLDALDPETELTAFVPKDPDVAGCLIEFRGPMAAAGAGARCPAAAYVLSQRLCRKSGLWPNSERGRCALPVDAQRRHAAPWAGDAVASRWLSASVDADPIERARLLRRAQKAVFNGQSRPQILRDIVLDSWLRSARAGVDPARLPPKIISEDEAADRLMSHRLGAIVPIVRSVLGGVAHDARHIVVISDATGLLLSSEGHPEMLEAASANHFVPGAMMSETAVGTNAVGTTLYLDHPLQIFSAEHFSSLFHGWTCSAAPIHDPSTGAVLGAIDLSGNFRTAHPHSVSLVTAVAKLVETRLALDAARRDASLRDRYLALVMRDRHRPSALVTTSGRVVVSSPPAWLGDVVEVPADCDRFTLPNGDDVEIEALESGEGSILWRVDRVRGAASRPKLRILALGRRRAALEQIGGTVELSPRHSELLTLLALRPGGLTSEELAFEIYGTNVKAVTIRAEMSRLRRFLGCLLLAHPYRLLADVDADFLEVERLVRTGDLAAATRGYHGPLLARSTVPGIVQARERLERALRPEPIVRRPGPSSFRERRVRAGRDARHVGPVGGP